jgi:hypothetical protein
MTWIKLGLAAPCNDMAFSGRVKPLSERRYGIVPVFVDFQVAM